MDSPQVKRKHAKTDTKLFFSSPVSLNYSILFQIFSPGLLVVVFGLDVFLTRKVFSLGVFFLPRSFFWRRSFYLTYSFLIFYLNLRQNLHKNQRKLPYKAKISSLWSLYFDFLSVLEDFSQQKYFSSISCLFVIKNISSLLK